MSQTRQQKKEAQRTSFCLGWEMGFEPTTLGTTIRYSNQLSYTHHLFHFCGNRLQKYYIFPK